MFRSLSSRGLSVRSLSRDMTAKNAQNTHSPQVDIHRRAQSLRNLNHRNQNITVATNYAYYFDSRVQPLLLYSSTQLEKDPLSKNRENEPPTRIIGDVLTIHGD